MKNPPSPARRSPAATVGGPPLPLLITGIAGVAGYNALRYFQAKFPGQVIGIRRRNNWRLSGNNIVACDMQDRDGVARLFDEYQFASVLHCEGSCALRACELDPLMAWRINVLGLQNLLHELSRRAATRLVHLSIDLVFSGRGEGGHLENAPTDPVTVYGKTMVQTERLVLDERPDAAVLRISLPMGVSFNGHAGAIDWIQSRFKQNKPATLYFDEIRTPAYTDCMNEVFERALADHELQGLYHAGGPRRLSLYQIAQIVNRVGGYDPDCLQGCFREEAGPVPPRAGNVTMESSKLQQAIGQPPFDPWPFHEQQLPTHHDWHRERGEFQGSAELLAETLYRNPAASLR